MSGQRKIKPWHKVRYDALFPERRQSMKNVLELALEAHGAYPVLELKAVWSTRLLRIRRASSGSVPAMAIGT